MPSYPRDADHDLLLSRPWSGGADACDCALDARLDRTAEIILHGNGRGSGGGECGQQYVLGLQVLCFPHVPHTCLRLLNCQPCLSC